MSKDLSPTFSEELNAELLCHPHRLLNYRQAMLLCGFTSQSSLYLAIEKYSFPKPSFIGHRRAWLLSDLVAWNQSHPKAATSAEVSTNKSGGSDE